MKAKNWCHLNIACMEIVKCHIKLTFFMLKNHIHLSLSTLSIHLSIYLFIYLSIYIFNIYLSNNLSLYQSVCYMLPQRIGMFGMSFRCAAQILEV